MKIVQHHCPKYRISYYFVFLNRGLNKCVQLLTSRRGNGLAQIVEAENMTINPLSKRELLKSWRFPTVSAINQELLNYAPERV